MDLLDRLLKHDAWTTGQLLTICRDLSDEQLDREFEGSDRSVRKILTHIIRNVEVWSDLMAGEPPRASGGTTIAELIARCERAARDLARVSRGVADRDAWDERWLDTLDDPPTEKTYGGSIAHVLTHSMHHRAQVLDLLRRLGVQPLPEGDVLSWESQVAEPRRAP